MSIELQHITKHFESFTALHDVNLSVAAGELMALLGPSGCGKTTLLRIIAGLEAPDHGCVRFYRQDSTAQGVRERQVGFVFQHYALFRHLTIAENVAFGLNVQPRHKRLSRTTIAHKVHDLLQLVQLHRVADRYPSQLSGGQRQRVALARALAVEPKVLLLDEPFGSLDAKVRKELRRWLRRLHDDLQITTVLVTHDQEEALEVADRIAVMNEGRIEQVGTVELVYNHPRTPFVYHFFGNVNLFHGRVKDGFAYVGPLRIAAPERTGHDEQPAVAYARPHDLDLSRTRLSPTDIEAVIAHISGVGPTVQVELTDLDTSTSMDVELPRHHAQELLLKVHDHVFVHVRAAQVFVKG